METIGYSPREIETVVNANDLSVVLKDSSPDITAEITSDIEGVYFSLFGGDITEIEVVVPISDVAVHIERDGTMEINGTFDGGMEVLVCLDAMFAHTHDGRYYTKDENDALIEGSEGRSTEYTDRSFAQAQEAQEMLRQSLMSYFTESINPITIQTMSLLAGAVELQYRYVNSKTTPGVTVDGISWNNTAKSLIVPSGGIIQHMTLGITSITSARQASDYRYWDMQEFDSGALTDGTKKYWLYAQVRRTGDTSAIDKDGYILSDTAIAFEDNINYPAHYNLLVGLLSSETNGGRSWVTMYGFTEILPGRITTDMIISPSGKTYINLSAGEGEGEIGGRIKFIGSNGTVQNLDSTVDGLQAQIDGQVIAWFYEYDPTLGNAPASEWTTDNLKDQHLNDTFTNNATGGCWRFAKVAGVYSWTVISDTATQQALIAAGHAQDTADGKKRVFTATPTTPYDVGDLWPGLSAGDLKVCTTPRATGDFVAGDWVLATKYTDDTTANAAATVASNAQTSANTANGLLSDIASDSKLTPVEKQSVKLEWDVIVAEKSKIDGQADYYGVSKTAYGSAYSTLNAYISPLLANLGATSNITGTTFRSNFAAYYAARQDVLDAIAEAAKDLADTAQATAIAAALVGNPNLIRDGYRMLSTSSVITGVVTYTEQLTIGKVYTLSAKGSRVLGAVTIIGIQRTISGTRWYYDMWLYNGGLGTTIYKFTCPETGVYEIYYYNPNPSAMVVEWIMLQEGSVYIDQNTAFKQTAEESVANLENLLEDSVERSITSGDGGLHPSYTNLRLASVFYNSSYPQFQVVLLNNCLYTFTINNSELSSGDIFSVVLFNLTDNSDLGSPLVDDAVPVGVKYKVTFRVPNDSKNWALLVYAGVRAYTDGKTITVHNIMLQYGPFSTPWKPCLKSLTEAMQGSTEITGGLILSNLIMLKNALGNVLAGLSGMNDNITLWGGGTYEQALTAVGGGTPLPVLLTKAGGGSNVGCLEVVDKDTVQINNGTSIVLLTTKTITQVAASLETITLQRTATLSPVAEGNNTLVSGTLTKTATYNRVISGGTITVNVSYGSGYTYFGEDFMFYVVENGTATQIGSTLSFSGLNPSGDSRNGSIAIPSSVLDFAASAGHAVLLRLSRISYSEGGTPDAYATFSNCKTEFAEINKQMIIANDGFCVSKDSRNIFKLYWDGSDLALSFKGKIGTTRGTLGVDSGTLKLT